MSLKGFAFGTIMFWTEYGIYKFIKKRKKIKMANKNNVYTTTFATNLEIKKENNKFDVNSKGTITNKN